MKLRRAVRHVRGWRLAVARPGDPGNAPVLGLRLVGGLRLGGAAPPGADEGVPARTRRSGATRARGLLAALPRNRLRGRGYLHWVPRPRAAHAEPRRLSMYRLSIRASAILLLSLIPSTPFA